MSSGREKFQILKAGDIVDGCYEILGVIDRNPDEILYAAKNRLLDKVVSLKFMYDRSEAVNFLRFQNEAAALSMLRHPNIAAMFELSSESQTPFMVMEKIEGRKLSAIIREENGMNYRRALPIFAQICDAMKYAHSLGVLHRELKPSAIFVAEKLGERNDFVKIVEFHTAKLPPRKSGPSLNMSPEQEQMGNPVYLSPEQLRGWTVDTRADIYGMGNLIFEVLLGSAPFSKDEILSARQNKESLRLPSFASRRPDLPLPDELEAIVRRAMDEYPEQRFQTMEELKNALMYFPGKRSIAKADSMLFKLKKQLDYWRYGD